MTIVRALLRRDRPLQEFVRSSKKSTFLILLFLAQSTFELAFFSSAYATVPPPPLPPRKPVAASVPPSLPPPAQSVPQSSKKAPPLPLQPPTGSTPPSSTPGALQAAASSVPPSIAPQMTRGNYDYRRFVNSSDPCAVSGTIDQSKYGCAGTDAAVQGAQVTNMLTQTAGSLATGALGQSAQTQALQSGTQAGVLKATANTQIQTGEVQLGIGGVNAALGVYQLYKYSVHNKNKNEITSQASGAGLTYDKATATNSDNQDQFQQGKSGWVTGNNSLSNKIINSFQMNEKDDQSVSAVKAPSGSAAQLAEIQLRQKENATHFQTVDQNVRQAASAAASEQSLHGTRAAMGALQSLAVGSQQILQGGSQIAAGKSLLNTVNTLSNSTGSAGAITLPSAGDLSASNAAAAGTSAISGDGTPDPQASAAATDNSASDNPLPDLGQGIGPNALPSSIPGGPTPGQFGNSEQNPGNPAGALGGGGAGTQAAAPGQEDPQSKLAPSTGGPNYESSGSGFTSGGNNGKNSIDGGPDLSGLLAKFLPQPQDPKAPQNDIISYGSHAAQVDDGSVLGRNSKRIFDRVSDTIMDKARHNSF